MNSFAMISSPRAALVALSHFYGVAPGVPPAEYEAALHAQLVAAGSTRQAETAEVKWLDDCFASYVVPNNQQ